MWTEERTTTRGESVGRGRILKHAFWEFSLRSCPGCTPSYRHLSPSISPLPRFSLQWQREGDLLGGDSKRRRRLGLTSRRWQGGGAALLTVHPGTRGYIYLFINLLTYNFVARLPSGGHRGTLQKHDKTGNYTKFRFKQLWSQLRYKFISDL